MYIFQLCVDFWHGAGWTRSGCRRMNVTLEPPLYYRSTSGCGRRRRSLSTCSCMPSKTRRREYTSHSRSVHSNNYMYYVHVQNSVAHLIDLYSEHSETEDILLRAHSHLAFVFAFCDIIWILLFSMMLFTPSNEKHRQTSKEIITIANANAHCERALTAGLTEDFVHTERK